MKTLAKPKMPARARRKTAAKIGIRATVAPRAVRAPLPLPIPHGTLKAAKAVDLIPPPSPDFDADYVAKIVAMR